MMMVNAIAPNSLWLTGESEASLCLVTASMQRARPGIKAGET
jgi:hypothetical protein